ncbi:MAG: hypothetical protein H0U49_06005 [Parachlamydiaceae bacterium]|nr:hypothetical protein [Parachlamydiaceae bacterium]
MFNNRKCLISFLHGILYLFVALDGTLESREFAFKREFEDTPPAFEKFYVDNSQLLSTPFGTFIKHADGREEPVRALMNDCYGTYVMKVKTQCPLCGQCYSGKKPPEDMCCPLYDKEMFPGIWMSP